MNILSFDTVRLDRIMINERGDLSPYGESSEYHQGQPLAGGWSITKQAWGRMYLAPMSSRAHCLWVTAQVTWMGAQGLPSWTARRILKAHIPFSLEKRVIQAVALIRGDRWLLEAFVRHPGYYLDASRGEWAQAWPWAAEVTRGMSVQREDAVAQCIRAITGQTGQA